MSLDGQVARMKARWPRFVAHNRDGQGVRWVGIVHPQLSRHTIEVHYRLGASPKVRVLSPKLTRRPDNSEGELPHVYPPSDDPTLCLFDPELDQWNWSMSIADTTVPWACDWLACYEYWVIAGVWHGGGRHAGDPLPDVKEWS